MEYKTAKYIKTIPTTLPAMEYIIAAGDLS